MEAVNKAFKDHAIYKKELKDDKYFKNKSICIAGGAGSVGSSLVKKLLKFNIKKLLIIDNNEYAIYNLKKKIGKNKNVEIKLASILDNDLLEKLFKKNKLDYIYNCAAVKHVDISEDNPEQTYRVNVEGTLNLLNLSKKYKLKKFILISSDKAYLPKGQMGKSKLEAENVTLNFKSNFQMLVLRFPNIIISSGSFLETIYECILKNKVFYLKNSRLKRFFIFNDDASEFIMRASKLKTTKKIIILKKVKSKNILDLIIFFKKHFNLKYKVSKIPNYEKIEEVYDYKEGNICRL